MSTSKVSVRELLAQHGLSWWALYRRSQGTISKSMAFDWWRHRHLPSKKSAALIARALGLPADYVLEILQTRNPWDNSPRAAWGTRVCKSLQEASTTAPYRDRIEAGDTYCLTCHQMIRKAA